MSLKVFGTEPYYSFPASRALVGHTQPGELIRYPVQTVNYPDLTMADFIRNLTTQSAKDVVTRHADKLGRREKGFASEGGQKHPMMERLRALFGQRDPQRAAGYGKPIAQIGQAHPLPGAPDGFQRIREDLAWRNNTAAPG